MADNRLDVAKEKTGRKLLNQGSARQKKRWDDSRTYLKLTEIIIKLCI